ncbi:MAG TPA: hypothetical protein VFO11_11505 [Candidatus Polarisedimenticolaceae bacterium]|nr:hypothetical protein [Candidatus Polarisedimenticolaceae bacterium]
MLRLALATAMILAATPESAPPVDLGVTEETGTALGQIDVTLTGSPEALARVQGDSFKVWVRGNRVHNLIADRLCPGGSAEEAAPPPRPTTWVLFFDQPRLTLSGRARALEIARAALPQILGPGDRAAIVSNEDRLATVQRWTSDPAVLVAGLDRLEKDPTQFDPMRTTDPLNRLDPRLDLHGDPAFSRADLSRLATVLGSFADVPPPKAVLYFADSAKLGMGDRYPLPSSTRARLWDDGVLTFDHIVRQAAALGIRFYTVEGRPLGTPVYDDERTAVAPPAGAPAHPYDEVPPQRMLVEEGNPQAGIYLLASETGGRAFLNGVTSERLVVGVHEDRSCMWLLSFDAETLPRDAFLSVRVQVDVPGVHVKTRSQTLVQSASERVKNRLLARYALDLEENGAPLRAGFVPIAWKDGKYSALIQVVTPPMSLPAATWDLGASMVVGEKVVAETSGRTTVRESNVPVALEQAVAVRPGTYELVAVARETTSDQIVSSRHQGVWPDPDAARATVVHPSVLQPLDAALTRDGHAGTTATVLHSEGDPLDAARVTDLLALVCRGKKVKSALEVERAVVGGDAMAFPLLTLDLGGERCRQVHDVIPAHALGAGQYRHQVVVRENGVEIARGETAFVVE